MRRIKPFLTTFTASVFATATTAAQDRFVAGISDPTEQFGQTEGPLLLFLGGAAVIALLVLVLLGHTRHKHLQASLNQLQALIDRDGQ